MVQLAAAFVVLTAVFAVVDRLAPITGVRRSWRAFLPDAAWFVTGRVVRLFTRALTIVLLVPVLLLVGVELGDGYAGFGPAARLPGYVQALVLLVASDGLGYVVHRAFHTVPWLWRIHAVHHASEHLDWLAATRVHPLNTMISTPLRALPLLVLGFDPTVLAGVTPVLGLYALVLHSDLRWRGGPLRHLVATPAFHRWHHAADVDGDGANFAGLLPVWDRLGGTFHLPEHDATRFGVTEGEAPPTGWWRALWAPFRPVPPTA